MVKKKDSNREMRAPFNLILTKTERETFEEAQKKLSLRNLADFMRAASWEKARKVLGLP